jgi:DNA-binding PadR family transcriptional regulator
MLKGDIELLAAIFLNKNTVKQLTTGRLARHSPYIISSLNALMKKGYILKYQTKGYVITEKGISALAEFCPECLAFDRLVHSKLLRKQMSEVSKAVKAIELLGSDYEYKIDSMLNR